MVPLGPHVLRHSARARVPVARKLAYGTGLLGGSEASRPVAGGRVWAISDGPPVCRRWARCWAIFDGPSWPGGLEVGKFKSSNEKFKKIQRFGLVRGLLAEGIQILTVSVELFPNFLSFSRWRRRARLISSSGSSS